MSASPVAEAPDHPPIQCLLELHYDGTVAITAKQGCTDEDIHGLLNQLADGMARSGPADGLTARREDAA